MCGVSVSSYPHPYTRTPHTPQYTRSDEFTVEGLGLGPLNSVIEIDLSVEGLGSVDYLSSVAPQIASLTLNVNRIETIPSAG